MGDVFPRELVRMNPSPPKLIALSPDVVDTMEAIVMETVKAAVETAEGAKWTPSTFYFASSFNVDGRPRTDAARSLIRALENETGWTCTSRWIRSGHHLGQAVGSTRAIMAVTDLTDLRAADVVLIVPLNGTARGAHVEMGAAFAWDKPTYLYRPRVKEGTAFDALCTDFPESWKKAVDAVLAEMGL